MSLIKSFSDISFTPWRVTCSIWLIEFLWESLSFWHERHGSQKPVHDMGEVTILHCNFESNNKLIWPTEKFQVKSCFRYTVTK